MGKTAPTASPFGFWLIAPLLLMTILNPLNSAMLSTALAPIGSAFPGQGDIGGWLVASLYLTAAVAQPVLGSFADRFGAKPVLIGATIILAVGGLVGMVAADKIGLITSRVLIGFGTSGAFPCAVAIIRLRAREAGVEAPTRILGFLAAASAVAVAIGPPLGGLLTEWLGWRGVFSVNLPLAIIAFILIFMAIPDRSAAPGEAKSPDWAGIGLFTVVMTAFVFFLMHLEDRIDWAALCLALVGGIIFLLVERRQRLPFIDVDLLKANRPLTLTYANHVAFNFVNYCYFYAMPQWSQTTLGLPLTTSGLLLMPVAVASFVASLLPTRGVAGFMIELVGALSLAIACAALVMTGKGTPVLFVLALSFGFGLSFGALNMSNQQRLLDYAPLEQSGSAAGLLRTSAYIGAMLSAPLVSHLTAQTTWKGSLAVLAAVAFPVSLIPILTVVADVRRGRHHMPSVFSSRSSPEKP